MEHLKLTFGSIMQSGILYYDQGAEDACRSICDYLKIDNLPSITGSEYFSLDGNQFTSKKIQQQQQVAVSEHIFSEALISKFRENNHNVLFVVEAEILVGVVHICDYNRDIVLQFVQDDMLSFERKLRQLIMLDGYSNEDMRKHFADLVEKSKPGKNKTLFEGKLLRFDTTRIEIESLGQFQSFDFSDLMSFANSYGEVPSFKFEKYEIFGKKQSSIETLRLLRNMAMHGVNPIGRDLETSIYSMNSLQALFDSLRILRLEYARLIKLIRNHPDFLRSIELENKSKLDIIHNHHPKALQFFLGF